MKWRLFAIIIFGGANVNAQSSSITKSRIEKLKKFQNQKDTIYNWVKNDLEFIQFKPHDVVADIGTFDGYYPMLYSIFTDSIDFTLVDTISNWSENLFDLHDICKNIKPNISNYFRIAVNTDTSICPENKFFDKVIIRDALHHFKFKDKMLTDIKRAMKRNASLFIYEPLKESKAREGLNCSGTLLRSELLLLLEKNNFKLKKELSLESGLSWYEFEKKP